MRSRNPTIAEHSISWMRLPRLWWASCRILSLRMELVMNTGNPSPYKRIGSRIWWCVFSFVFHKSCMLFERRERYDSSLPSLMRGRVPDGRPANLSQPSYRLSRLTSSICGALTSPTCPSHLLCRVLMGGLCCIPACKTWGIIWAGDRLIVSLLYSLFFQGWQTDRKPGHINNLYNTTFWALIQMGGLDAKEAEKELAVSFTSYGPFLKVIDRILGFCCRG